MRVLAYSFLVFGLGLVGSCKTPTAEEPSSALNSTSSNLYNGLVAKVIQDSRNQKLSDVPLDKLATSDNSNLKLLVETPEIYRSAAKLIENAEYEVLIATYTWDVRPERAQDGNEPAKTLFTAIAKAAKKIENFSSGTPRQLKVKILINQIQLLSSPEASIKEIVNSVEKYLAPLDFDKDKLDIRIATFPHKTLGNLHDKMIVVDGKHTVVTGANIQSNNNFKPYRWFDLGFQVSGPFAAAATEEFDHKWNHGYEVVTGRNWRWQCKINSAGKLDCKVDPVKFVVNPGKRRFMKFRGLRGQTSVIALPQSCEADSIVADRNLNSPQNAAWVYAFENAKSSIKVLSPNIDAEDFIRLSGEAAARGVNVKIVSSKGFNAEKIDIVGDTNTQVFEKLKSHSQAGTKLLGKWFVPEGETVPPVGGVAKAMHAKLLIADDEVVIMGSGNQDRFAWYHSCEFNAAFAEKQPVREAVAVFDKIWQRSVNAL